LYRGGSGMITPYYQSDLVTLYLDDARDVLPTLATESVDLILTDPPYGVEWQSNRRSEKFDLLDNDSATDRDGITEVLRECVRVVGQNRHLYVFGPPDVLVGLKVSAPATLVWDKVALGSGDVTAAWAPAHEQISFVVSKHRHAGKSGTEGLPTRLRKGSVLRFPRPTGRKVRHPSEKPVPLLRELIESSSRQGDLIGDAFAGVGSTGVAAVLSGRRALLMETEKQWADVAVERIQIAEELARQGAAT
jgi:site-specific DNA-methyltransferase (adenine-specific)